MEFKNFSIEHCDEFNCSMAHVEVRGVRFSEYINVSDFSATVERSESNVLLNQKEDAKAVFGDDWSDGVEYLFDYIDEELSKLFATGSLEKADDFEERLQAIVDRYRIGKEIKDGIEFFYVLTASNPRAIQASGAMVDLGMIDSGYSNNYAFQVFKRPAGRSKL